MMRKQVLAAVRAVHARAVQARVATAAASAAPARAFASSSSPAAARAPIAAAPRGLFAASPLTARTVSAARVLPAAPAAPSRAFSAGALPEHIVLAMPALSPTMESGGLASWDKKEGDEVKAGDVLAQIETDKATVSFDSTEDGFIAKILVAGGAQNVAVGTPVAIMVENAEDVAAFANYTGGAGASASPSAAAAAPAAATAPAAAAAAAAAPAASAASAAPAGRVVASPAAKALASERGVSLAQVNGTGPNHRILKADVAEFVPSAAAAVAAAPVAVAAAKPAAAAAAAAAPAVALAAAAPAGGDYTDVPLTAMRRVIAARLSESKQTVPHYYVTMEVQMDAVNALRAQLNKQLAAGVKDAATAPKLSVNDFIIKATAAALKKVPAVNASWQGTAIRQYNYADISVAVATDAGLITPIIADADAKGLAGISKEMKDLAKRAREGKLQPAEYQGGCFTISNLGMFGVKHFSAIINPPQAGILAVGGTDVKVVPNPAAAADAAATPFKTVSVMSVTASFDHRVVDGAVGAQWLDAFKGFLEKPTTMLL
jgi:pyruvate dehydrogenase E2 component (dihydrolipoamide acetyltransferase)